MEKKLRVLILEDLSSDVELVERELKTVLKNYAVKVVDAKEGFDQALETFKPDLIISDYQMPAFDGLSALKLTREKSPFTPFIILTGSMNEDIAVECMKAGADDYVLKEHIKRLGPAVSSALEKKKMEQERNQAMAALRESEDRYRTVSELTSDYAYVFRVEPDGELVNEWVTGALTRATGYSIQELQSLGGWERLIHPDDLAIARNQLQALLSNQAKTVEYRVVTKDGKVRWMRDYARPTWNVTESRVTRFEGAVQDITERKRAEAMVQESEERFRTIFESEPECVKLLDENGTVIRMNPAGLKMVDADTPDQVEGKSVYPLLSPEYLPAFKAFNAKVLQGESGIMEFEIVGLKGNHRLLESHAVPIRNIKGKVTSILSITRDITERKQAEEALRESETLFRTIFESALSGSALVNEEGRIIQTNRSIENMLGYTSDELQNMTIAEFTFPGDVDENSKLFNEMLEGKRDSYRMEKRYCRKDASVIWGDLLVAAIRDKNGVLQYGFATVVDITERKHAEEEIQRNLQEKTILLNEIHHRVKNSLQVVASLLLLQSRKITDKHILDLFNQSRNRINMMASVYEKLYRSENFASIDFKEYLEDVLNKMYGSSGLSHRVSFKMDIKNVVLGLNDAIPVALILNELFTNSIKYAFPENKKGAIEISFNLSDEETYQLIYKDNGIGLPDIVDFKTTETLGLHLVKMLAKQINGDAVLKQNGWTTFKIEFKGYGYSKKKYSHR